MFMIIALGDVGDGVTHTIIIITQGGGDAHDDEHDGTYTASLQR